MKMSRRKKFLILPKFQISFVLYSSMSAFFVIAIVYLSNQFFFWKMQKLGQEIGLSPNHVFFDFIEKQKSSMSSVFLATSLLVALYLFVFGVLYSHRIAGPIYRIQEDLKKMSSGGLGKKIKFRKGDYFQELAEAVNSQIFSNESQSQCIQEVEIDNKQKTS